MSRNESVGGVAAGHMQTARAAAEILADGGNAFDAAIAAVWTACVCEPVLASPGGGGFFMALPDDVGAPRLFDFFANTPRQKVSKADVEFEQIVADFGPATQAFCIGAGASAVPGLVPGLFRVHAALGRMPMARLCEYACRLAKEGVKVNAFQAYLFQVVRPILTWTPEGTALYAPKGHLLEENDTFFNPELADALDSIAREGAPLVTQGAIGRAIDEGMRDYGGYLQRDDLADYRVEERVPLSCAFHDYTVSLNPQPAAGGALIASMLRRYVDFNKVDGTLKRPVNMARAIHFVDSAWRRNPGAFTGIATNPSSRGTTHISVIDRFANAAAVTVSNGEGNGRLVRGCGFMLNNMLGEDDLHPYGLDAWTPGVRLSSMMAPSLARHLRGRLIALGSGGSNRIRTAITQVLCHLCESGLPPEAAVNAPRLHVEAGKLDFEDVADQPPDERLAHLLLPALNAGRAWTEGFAAHRVWPRRNMFFGGAHAVIRGEKGAVTGAGDRRRSGVFIAV